MLCFILSGALCYASGVAGTENEKGEGIPIEVKKHVNVYQLGWDCETEEIIACQSDLVNFDYAVKKSISITSTINGPVVSNTDKVTFRVADTFEIIGPFEVQQGGEFAVIQQDCPSDE